MESAGEVVELGTIKDGADFFAQYGPWCLLAVGLIFAVGYAGMKIGQWFATQLADRNAKIDELNKEHEAKIEALHSSYSAQNREMTEKVVEVVENNNKGTAVLTAEVANLKIAVQHIQEFITPWDGSNRRQPTQGERDL